LFFDVTLGQVPMTIRDLISNGCGYFRTTANLKKMSHLA
jgi:hypothetical protein